MLYGFRADIAPINSSLFIRFEIGSGNIPFSKHSSLFEIKDSENTNHRNIGNISRIKI